MAPYCFVAAILAAGAVSGITTVHPTFSWPAANARPCAWLPAETVTRPAALCASDSVSTRLMAPRGLKLPVFWRHSALSERVASTVSPMRRAVNIGVRWTHGAIRLAADVMSSLVFGGMWYSPSRRPRIAERSSVSMANGCLGGPGQPLSMRFRATRMVLGTRPAAKSTMSTTMSRMSSSPSQCSRTTSYPAVWIR